MTKPVLERYQRFLYHYRKKNGDPLSFRSQHTRLVPLRTWFKWLAKEGHVAANPAADLELPRLGQQLPKHVLTVAEAEKIMNTPDVSEPLGLRDRAIVETFYSTGIRRKELIGLTLYAFDRSRGVVAIRQGKGNKDRVVPIGERALAWIDRYAEDVRPMLAVSDRAGDVLFLNQMGEPFTPNGLTQIVRDIVLASGVGKPGACHLFRHTMATLMLEAGTDIRFIQLMLGHVSLSTTQLYTQVSIKKLKEVHTALHPAKPSRSPRPDE